MSKHRYEKGSANVFRDLGVPNAEEHFIKAQQTLEAVLPAGHPNRARPWPHWR